jgi:hypothetical protein
VQIEDQASQESFAGKLLKFLGMSGGACNRATRLSDGEGLQEGDAHACTSRDPLDAELALMDL